MKIYDAIGFNSNLTGSFTGSFTGDGTYLTGVSAAGTISSSAQIASEISGSFTLTSASFATTIGNLTSDYTQLTNIPGGIISSSKQFPSNIVSSSKQLPSNLVSSSAQLSEFSGSFSGSFEGDGSGLTGINLNVVTQSLVTDTFSVTGSHTVRHNFGTKNIITQVYDTNDFVITPSNIQTADNDTVKISFSTSESGRAVVAKGGHVVTALQNTNSSSYAATSTSASNASKAVTVHNNYLLSGSLSFWSGPKQVYDSFSGSADANTVYFVKE